MDRGRTIRKPANLSAALPRIPGGANPGPVALDVLWLAPDEVSLYGLAALLDLAAPVSAYEVCMDAPTAERRLQEHSFNVCVFPVESYTASVGELAEGCGSTLILTLPDDEHEPGNRAPDGRPIEYWLPRRQITLDVLQKIFLRISGTMPRRTDPALFGDRGLRILQRVTERERDVLVLLARGQSNQQIAQSLGISIHGVKRHVSNLLLKFDCSNRTEVALAAAQLELDLSRQSDGR